MAKQSAVEPSGEAGSLASRLKSSSLVDTRVVYCGDNLDLFKKLPDACVDLIYMDPPFNAKHGYNLLFKSPARPSPQEEGFHMRRFLGQTSDGIGRTIVRKTEKCECGKSSPGKRI
jgi:hypothetical protein